MRKVFLLLLIPVLFSACTEDRKPTKGPEKKKALFRLETRNLSNNGNYFYMGDSVEVKVIWLAEDIPFEEVSFNLGEVTIGKASNPTTPLVFKLLEHTGTQSLRGKSNSDTKYVSFTVFSDTPAKKLKWELRNAYPHDIEAFTQGLCFDGEVLFEGTGQKKRSSLRKVNLEDGSLIQSTNLPSEIFGEGITVVDGKVYQLSWEAQRGFIWNADDLSFIQEFVYPGEGWGITHNNDFLFRTDGSNRIFVIDKNSLQAVRTIEVYNERAAISNLNELEWINGHIYANIWGTTEIAIIDPVSGKVEYYLDLKELEDGLPPGNGQRRDVMNGIAYNAEKETIYITGKLWPQLFELKILSE